MKKPGQEPDDEFMDDGLDTDSARGGRDGASEAAGDDDGVDRPPVREAPGESPRKQPRRAAGPVVLYADRSGAILRADDAALSEDSLPVLTAFRQFLEAERRRTRRQMVAMGAAFTVLLVGLSAGAFVLALRFADRLRTEVDGAQTKVEESQVTTMSNIQAVARATVGLRRDLTEEKKAIHEERAALDRKLSAQSSELQRLMDTITSLELENAMLAGSVQTIQSRGRAETIEPPLPLPPPQDAAAPTPLLASPVVPSAPRDAGSTAEAPAARGARWPGPYAGPVTNAPRWRLSLPSR